MIGVTFDGLHTYDDLGLILSSKEIGSPEVKTRKIDIEGGDGSLDLTDFFGGAKYDDVTHRFTFQVVGVNSLTRFSQIKSALHGKRGRIILDDDPSFFYVGRLYVSSYTSSRGIGTVEIEAVCDPWKYKSQLTSVTQAISGSGNVTLTNGRRRAVPTITTTASMTISFGGKSITRNAGTFTVAEFEIVEGRNVFSVTGTGTITFRWQEGEL